MSSIYSPSTSFGKPGETDERSYRARTDGPKAPPRKLTVKVRLEGNPPIERLFEGRLAWTLTQLLGAGENGCTPMDQPAPRWSDYVFKLRRAGVAIETLHEAHGGSFSGHHGRYVLRSRVTILENSFEDGDRP
jgi:hypothetical protein